MKLQNKIYGNFVTRVVMACAILSMGLVGCASPGSGGSMSMAGVLRSEKPRLRAPALEEAQLPELVAGNTRFALDLYAVLFNSHENLFIRRTASRSPWP